MRCHICNTVLSPTEIQWNKDHKDWDPCITCLEAIDEVFNDDLEEDIDKQLTFEFGEEDDELLELGTEDGNENVRTSDST